MANTSSAKKQILITERNRERSQHFRSAMRTAVKQFVTILEASDENQARAALHNAQKVINRTVSKGVLKKQTSARKVSRLYHLFNKKFGREEQPSGN
jgi:small subunit ribosomal protein S20